MAPVTVSFHKFVVEDGKPNGLHELGFTKPQHLITGRLSVYLLVRVLDIVRKLVDCISIVISCDECKIFTLGT